MLTAAVGGSLDLVFCLPISDGEECVRAEQLSSKLWPGEAA